MNKSLIRNHWHSTLVSLHSSSNDAGYWPGDKTSENPVRKESELVLPVNFTMIFPWNTLGASHVLVEPIRNPGIASHVCCKEIDVFILHLFCWHRWGSQLKNFISLSDQLVLFTVLFAVVNWLPVNVVICVIVCGRHVFQTINIIIAQLGFWGFGVLGF